MVNHHIESCWPHNVRPGPFLGPLSNGLAATANLKRLQQRACSQTMSTQTLPFLAAWPNWSYDDTRIVKQYHQRCSAAITLAV